MKLNSVATPASPIVVGSKARVLSTQTSPFAKFQISQNPTKILATVGIALKAPAIQLFRSASLDIATATLLQSWTGPFAPQQNLQFAESLTTGKYNYWLRVVYDAASSQTQDIGPQSIDLTPTGGTGATAAVLTVANGTNKSVAVAYPTATGSGYFTVPLVTFTGSSLSHNATGIVTIDGAGHVQSIAITDPGLYATADSVSVNIHY